MAGANSRCASVQFVGRGSAARPPHLVGCCGFGPSVLPRSTPVTYEPRAHRPVEIRTTAHGHSARIGGTSAAMKSKCPQHITQAPGRWGGDSLELYERVDIEESLHWFSEVGKTDVNPAKISRLKVQQDLPDPKEDEAESAIETELRAFSPEAGG